jgi:hypothetical protein
MGYPARGPGSANTANPSSSTASSGTSVATCLPKMRAIGYAEVRRFTVSYVENVGSQFLSLRHQNRLTSCIYTRRLGQGAGDENLKRLDGLASAPSFSQRIEHCFLGY